MKKKPIIFFLLAAASTLSVTATACKHSHDYRYDSDAYSHWQYCTDCDEKSEAQAHADGNADGKCDVCEHVMPAEGITLDKTQLDLDKGATASLTATATPENANKTVQWSSSNNSVATVTDGTVTAIKGGKAVISAVCDNKQATCNVAVYTTVSFDMNGRGEQIESVKVAGEKIARPQNPVSGGYAFEGWFTDSACTDAFDFETVVEDNLTLYAKWSEHEHDFDKSHWLFDAQNHYHGCKLDGCNFKADTAAHELDSDLKCRVCGAQLKDATFELIPSNLTAQTYKDGLKTGIFSILPDTTIRNRARENTAVFDAQGNEVATGFTASKSVQYNGTNRGIGIYAPAAGKLTLYLENGSSGLTEEQSQKIILTKPDGTTVEIPYPAKKLRAVVIDIPEAGEYKLTRGSNGTTDIYYAKFEARVPVTPIEDIQISHTGKTEYLIGQSFDKSEMQVQVIYSITQMVEPVSLDDERLKIDSSAFDGTKAGKYSIKVTFTDDGKTFTKTFDVSVYDVEAIELGFNKIVTGSDGFNGIYVNEALQQLYFTGDALNIDGLTVKTVFNGGKQKKIVTEGFTVITDGLDMSTTGIKEIKVKWADSETIFATFKIFVMARPQAIGETITLNVNGAFDNNTVGSLSEGAYRFRTVTQALNFLEALELDQNVKKVINLAEGTYSEKLEINVPNLTINGSADASKTVIEWDALFGEVDESGFTHTTDSTATLNVRRAATGFTIEGVTISNKWNSTEYFDEQKGPNYGEHRALAVLIQADKVVVDNCRMLGYQDTVEFFTGRQYVKNTYIQGRTDFIFGTNNTTYFENCEIHSIVSSGYVTAFKGSNSGASDAVLYGAIFDGCRFTAPESVTKAKDTAIGRPWGAYAAVAVINSELGGHITTTEYTGKSSGERYVTMGNCKPTDATVKFVEYNNTGAGAITVQQAGMTLLDAATAAKYSNLSTVFSKTNGKVSYTSDWDGSKGVTITEFNYKFSDYYTANDGFTFHETPEDGEPFMGELGTVTGSWGHELNQNKDQAKFVEGAQIRFNVEGTVYITAYGGSYGVADNFKINYVGGKAVITVVATETSPIVNGAYVTMITLDKSKTGVHTHEFGEWTITASTTDTVGSAERRCLDCELAQPEAETITLPILSLDSYTAATGANGKIIYTLKADNSVVFEADPIPGVHVHDYGAWKITATLEAAGTATKSCNGEDCDVPEISVNIPALTDSAYTVTNNTAKLDVAGEGDYSITVDGEEITFRAATPAITIKRVSQDYTFSYAQGEPVVNNEYIVFEKAAANNDWIKFGGAGSSITLNLPEGATLRFTRSPYDNAKQIAINGVLTEGNAGAEITYVVRVAGYVTITADATAYFKTLSVEIDDGYQHVHTFGEWKITAPTSENEGSATKSCIVPDCGLEGATATITLPVLSAEAYSIAPSATEGKSVYTLKSDTSVSFEASALADVHVHNYGEWQFTLPTSQSVGSAVKSCTPDCPDGDITVNLPVLSDGAYTITDNTATLEAAGTGKYTYVDATYGQISFTAATPKIEPTLIESSTTVNIGAIDIPVEGAIYNHNGVIIDATNGKLRPNGGNVQLNPGTKIVMKVAEGADISIAWYNANDAQYGADANADISIVDGIATITIKADPDGVTGKSGIYVRSITVSYGIKEITESGTYYSYATDKAQSNQYVLIEGDCYDNNNYLCFITGTITIKVAAGATIEISGGYYDGNNWGLYSAYEEGSDTPLTDTLANNGSSFTTVNGGTIIIKKAEGATQSSLTTIKVTFPA